MPDGAGTTQTPECPATKPPSAAGAAVIESTLVCSATLVINHMLVLSNLAANRSFAATIIYPLSQSELFFILQKLGVGSQVWSQQSNLPKIDHLWSTWVFSRELSMKNESSILH
jgi:hypothetical protein